MKFYIIHIKYNIITLLTEIIHGLLNIRHQKYYKIQNNLIYHETQQQELVCLLLSLKVIVFLRVVFIMNFCFE